MKKFLVCLLILLILFLSLPLASSYLLSLKPSSVQEITAGWEYQWGEASLEENNSWKTWDFQEGHLEKDPQHNFLWLKVKLPPGEWQNPTIYFYGLLANSLTVYLDDQPIYYSQETNTILGNQVMRKIIVSLPSEWQGKTLFVRLQADSNQYIGMYGDVLVGLHKDILAKLFKHEFQYLILGFFFLILALVMGTVSIFIKDRQQKKALFSLIIFIICTGSWNIAEYDNVDLVLFYSPGWGYLDSIAILLAPMMGLYFFEQIFGPGPGKIIRRLWQFQGFYLIPYLVVLALDITLFNNKIYSFLSIYYSWDIIKALLIVYSLVLIWVVGGLVIQKNNLEIKIFAGGVALLALSLICVDLYLVNWGIFAFVLSLILILANRFVDVHDRLAIYSKELKEKNFVLDQWNKTLEQTVTSKTASLRDLLNNAGQGFLSFGEDLIIDGEYSQECRRIFGEAIENKNIVELIFSKDEEEKSFLGSILQKILRDKDGSIREKYLPLLPDELKINGKDIQLEYRVIREEDLEIKPKLMLIITDVTDKRLLESRVESERNVLRMVVNSITHQIELQQYIIDYQNFCQRGLLAILTNDDPWEEKIAEVFRAIHTFKGNFNQLELVNMVEYLHQMESWLVDLQKDFSQVNPAALERCLRNMPLGKWLEEDLDILQSVLGKSFFEQLESLAVNRIRPFQELLSSYPPYIARLAEILNKKIQPLEIQGGELLVDGEKYSGFTRSLVHIFRNTVAHGLEDLEERLKKNKSEFGKIECQFELMDNHIYLTIKDDGAGINEFKVKKTAINQGIYTLEEIEKLTKEEVLALIFNPGFSTAEQVDQISGRGIGLSAVKKELEKIGGRMEVSTEKDQGTEFRFILPI